MWARAEVGPASADELGDGASVEVAWCEPMGLDLVEQQLHAPGFADQCHEELAADGGGHAPDLLHEPAADLGSVVSRGGGVRRRAGPPGRGRRSGAAPGAGSPEPRGPAPAVGRRPHACRCRGPCPRRSRRPDRASRPGRRGVHHFARGSGPTGERRLPHRRVLSPAGPSRRPGRRARRAASAPASGTSRARTPRAWRRPPTRRAVRRHRRQLTNQGERLRRRPGDPGPHPHGNAPVRRSAPGTFGDGAGHGQPGPRVAGTRGRSAPAGQ